MGPSYGYFVNASKTWLIVKPEYLDLAGEVFRNTEGKRYLGDCIGCQQFTTEYVNEKVMSWTASLLTLSIRLVSLTCMWDVVLMYMVWLTNGDIFFEPYAFQIFPDLLQPLEDAIFHHFIPALVDKPVSGLEQALFALPVCLGGLGICNPQVLADSEFAASVKVTWALVECILHQRGTYIIDIVCQRQAKAEVVALNVILVY